MAIRLDAVPMPLDHGGEALKGWQPLPTQRSLPLLEEATRPIRLTIAPESAKRLLQQIGPIEALVDAEEFVKGLLLLRRQILPTREQHEFLALNVAPVIANQTSVLPLANII